MIETHIDDWGFVCYLVAGERFNGDVIHIACKIVDDVVQINTVYFPIRICGRVIEFAKGDTYEMWNV